MIEQNVAELIAEARANIESAAEATTGKFAERIRTGDVADDRLRLLVKLADALEASDEMLKVDIEEALAYSKELEKTGAERDAAYAVIERIGVEYFTPDDTFPADKRMLELATTVPADALREHDAALIEKLADDLPRLEGTQITRQQGAAHWLREQAQERREEATDER